jgi:hypothetical protein
MLVNRLTPKQSPEAATAEMMVGVRRMRTSAWDRVSCGGAGADAAIYRNRAGSRPVEARHVDDSQTGGEGLHEIGEQTTERRRWRGGVMRSRKVQCVACGGYAHVIAVAPELGTAADFFGRLIG